MNMHNRQTALAATALSLDIHLDIQLSGNSRSCLGHKWPMCMYAVHYGVGLV